MSPSPTNPDFAISQILTFWFTRPPMHWLFAPPGLDSEIRAQFSHLVTAALGTDLDHWSTLPTATAKSCLAHVILLDQFTRNVYRGTREAFGGDEKAYRIAESMLEEGRDGTDGRLRELGVMQVSALIMPFMHRESLEAVGRAGELWRKLLERCKKVEEEAKKTEEVGEKEQEAAKEKREREMEWCKMGVDAAEGHKRQLELFGRYPTRNRVLGRESTKEEEDFLRREFGGKERATNIEKLK